MASSLKFGTSGLRGLVTDLAGEPSRQWTSAFLGYLDDAGLSGRPHGYGRVAICVPAARRLRRIALKQHPVWDGGR
jgi:hypothetical protein